MNNDTLFPVPVGEPTITKVLNDYVIKAFVNGEITMEEAVSKSLDLEKIAMAVAQGWEDLYNG